MSADIRATIDVPGADVPAKAVQTRVFVIAGGPCSGKTTVLNELQRCGHHVEYEPAELLLRSEIAAGKTADEVRRNPFQWQRRVAEADFKLFSSIPHDKTIFADTSLVETYVFTRRSGMEFGVNLLDFMKRYIFAGVFFLEPLLFHEATQVRMEDMATARSLGNEIYREYQRFGYEPQRIPPLDPARRASHILSVVDACKGAPLAGSSLTARKFDKS